MQRARDRWSKVQYVRPTIILAIDRLRTSSLSVCLSPHSRASRAPCLNYVYKKEYHERGTHTTHGHRGSVKQRQS